MKKSQLRHLIKEEMKRIKEAPEMDDGMDDDMREFRSLLDGIDGQQSELEYALRQVSLEDPGLEMQLEDALTALETVITEIQESQGWI
jgi:hypothetical protein